jgi:hypothetical protein
VFFPLTENFPSCLFTLATAGDVTPAFSILAIRLFAALDKIDVTCDNSRLLILFI